MSANSDSAAAVLRDHGLEGCESALGAYIAHQRWAGAHGRTVETTAVVDAAVISEAAPILLHTLTAVTYTDGATMRYALPLGVREPDDALAERAPEFVIPWSDSPKPMLLYDAVGDATYIEWLLDAIREKRVLATSSGTLRCSCPDPLALDTGSLSSIRPLRVEQSNTSVEVGDALFLKHLRRVEAGPSAELEMSDALAASGFTHVAPLLGRAVWASGTDAPSPLVLIQRFLHNSSEGWALALTSLRDLYATAEGMGSVDAVQRRATVDDQDAAFVAESARLGRVIAEMHLALGGAESTMETAPLTQATLARWATAMTEELDALCDRARCGAGPAPRRPRRCGRAFRRDASAPARRAAHPRARRPAPRPAAPR